MALAGAAAAEVKITGSAEMGVVGGNNDKDVLFHQSVDVRFAMTGESDGGLAFGATVDLDDITDMGKSGNGAGDIQGKNPDYTVFLKGAFGTLTMGDTDGAFDWAMTEVNGAGSIADDETAHAGFNGNAGLDGSLNGQVVRYDYGFGDFSVALSAEVRGDTAAKAAVAGSCWDDSASDVVAYNGTGCADAGDIVIVKNTAAVSAVESDNALGIGFKYSGEMGGMKLGFGVAAQANEGHNIAGASAKLSTNGFDVTVNYSDLDGLGGKEKHTAIGVTYTTGALVLHANYGIQDLTAGGEDKGYGLSANYGLGGGATILAGYGKSDKADGGDDATWSLGLGLSF